MSSSTPESDYQWQSDFLNVGNQKLRYAVYKNTQAPVRSFLVLFQGRSEWIEKYHPLAEELKLPPGYALLTWDHRGQGASTGKKRHIDSYEQFANDAKFIIDTVVGKRDYAILAHSMGALIALYGCLKQLFEPKFLALCSPLLRLPNEPIPRFLAYPLSELISISPLKTSYTGVATSEKSKFYQNPLTHSFEGFKKVLASPHGNYSPTFGWVKASFEACKFVFEKAELKKLKVNCILIGGNEESVVDYQAFSHWVQSARSYSSQHIEFVKVEGARHELFNEIPRYRKQVLKLIRSFGEKQDFFN